MGSLTFLAVGGLLLLVMARVSSEADQQCHTIWFRETSDGYCECGSSLGSEIQCDNTTGRVSMALGYCMTYSNVSGKLQPVTGFTNLEYVGFTNRVYVPLPENISELNAFMCNQSSRHGFLCGECDRGLGYAVNSLHSKCVECSSGYAVGMFLLCATLPMTIFFSLVVMFRLNIPSGPLLGYIIYCQSFIVAVRSNTAFLYLLYNNLGLFGRFSLQLSLSLAGLWWYFITLFYYLPPLCLHHEMSRLDVISMEYAYALYPLSLLLATWICIELHARNFRPIVWALKPFHRCLAKVRRNWSTSDSIIHAYATFFFLSFIYQSFASFNLLHASSVYNSEGEAIRTVLVYDPTLEAYSPQHLVYAIPAILLLFFLGLCPTLFLCFHTTRLHRCLRLRPRTQLMINTFVDTFQCCYKDGLNGTYDFRFLCSAPMFMALLTLLFSLMNTRHNFQQHTYFLAVFSLVCLILSSMVAFIRPYKSLYMNISISFHAAVISVLSVIVTLLYNGHIMSDHILASACTLFTILPHFVALATLVYHCLRHISCVNARMQAMSKVFSSFFIRSPNTELTESSLPDRLKNSYAYRTIPTVP